MSEAEAGTIESILTEDRVFDPPSAFSAGAHVSSLEDYKQQHARSIEDPAGYWAEVAQELDWFEPWTEVMQWNAPDAKWFVGGKTNLCHNAVDRQVKAGHGDDLAILWEGEPCPDGKPEVRRLTYRDLQRETARAANALKALGVKKGDVVTLYMGMVPRAGDRHPGLRPDRRGPLGDLRRLQRAGDRRPGRRRRQQGDRDLRRLLAAGQGRAPQGQRRPGLRHDLAGPEGPRPQAVRERRQHAGGSRPVVARAGGGRQRRLPVRAHGQRGHGVPPLHVRVDREAQGDPAHHRRLHGLHLPDQQADLRPCTPTRTRSTGAPPTSAGSPGTATSSTGSCPTASRPSCTRARPTSPRRTASGTSASGTRSRSSIRRRPRSARS